MTFVRTSSGRGLRRSSDRRSQWTAGQLPREITRTRVNCWPFWPTCVHDNLSSYHSQRRYWTLIMLSTYDDGQPNLKPTKSLTVFNARIGLVYTSSPSTLTTDNSDNVSSITGRRHNFSSQTPSPAHLWISLQRHQLTVNITNHSKFGSLQIDWIGNFWKLTLIGWPILWGKVFLMT